MEGEPGHGSSRELFASPAKRMRTTLAPYSPSKSSTQMTAGKISRKARAYCSPVKRTPVPVPPRGKLGEWSHAETSALVQFIAMHKDKQSNPESNWPMMKKDHPYWLEAAEYIHRTSKSSSLRIVRFFTWRTGGVRSRTQKLKEEHDSIDQAEEALGITIDAYQGDHASSTIPPASLSLPPSLAVDLNHLTEPQKEELLGKLLPMMTEHSLLPVIMDYVQNISSNSKSAIIKECFKSETLDHVQILDDVLFRHAKNSTEDFGCLPAGNFIKMSLTAMKKLKALGKSNLVYKWPRCIALTRPGSDESLMPLERMPFGLIEYQIDFFNADHVNQVKVSKDFELWRQTLDAELTARQDKVLTGPMWSGCSKEDMRVPIKARVNIACRSKMTVRRNLKKEVSLSTKPEIQMSAIDQLKDVNPNGRYWIKLDGCDLKAVVQESMRGEWNGDSDLLDGKLEALRREYEERKAALPEMLGAADLHQIKVGVKAVVEKLEGDLEFLSSGLEKACKTYTTKFKAPNTAEEALKAANWEVVEFTTLLTQCQQFASHMTAVFGRLTSDTLTVRAVRDDLKIFQSDYRLFLKNLFKKKRQPPASHVLVFMLSDERRSKKPYAAPVQYIPYYSLRDQYIRDFTRAIKEKMTSRGLLVVGTVTDGEFCSLRSQGESRPLHLWQLVHDAREAVSRMKKDTILKILLPTNVIENGIPVMRKENVVVPDDFKMRVYDLVHVQGRSAEDAFRIIREEQVPDGYIPHAWTATNNLDNEPFLERLRSVLATLYFRHSVDQWCEKGVDFKTYMYIPEVDTTTGEVHHERADHCHLLKRIANHTRLGRYEGLDVDALDRAMQDRSTGLTAAALRGVRKQSVPDAEKLLSFPVAAFLETAGEVHIARYVRLVAQWHEASDGRGLSQRQRSKYNYEMYNYLLEDFMPWYQEMYDFKTLDVNRRWDTVRGFSRETLVEITTNIESQEYRRRQNGDLGYVEHPRAGTTDDVECFFSICHRYLGDIFTLLEFKNRWMKIINEFNKRMDDSLPFYYWTLNERFTMEQSNFDDRPVFDEDVDPTKHPLRLHRLKLSSREDSSIFTAGRSFLPTRNKQSLRQRFHRLEVGLPPVPEHQRLQLPIV